jgi:hypothetical protein
MAPIILAPGGASASKLLSTAAGAENEAAKSKAQSG